MSYGEIHGFDERLADSRKHYDFAEAVLREYFGRPRGEIAIDFSPDKIPFQHDVTVHTANRTYRVELKIRGSDYHDELLEDLANEGRGTPGWTWNAGTIDFVFHLYPRPSRRWEVFPGVPLERAWRKYRDWWRKTYGIKRARNPLYDTVNVPVPTDLLKRAVAAEGAPLCPHCGRNVGKFGSRCASCGRLSCCHVSDPGVGFEWICPSCCERRDGLLVVADRSPGSV